MTKKQTTFCKTPDQGCEIGMGSFIVCFLIFGLLMLVEGCVLVFGYDPNGGVNHFIAHLQQDPFSFGPDQLQRAVAPIAMGLLFIVLFIIQVRDNKKLFFPTESKQADGEPKW